MKTKYSFFVFAVLAFSCLFFNQDAHAIGGGTSGLPGGPGPSPEMPTTFIPFVLIGFTGLIFWIRNFFKK